jgi:cytochrome c peroxidase
MSCEGRDWQDIGRKMILKVPLALQKIHADDSVFGKNGPFGDLRNKSGIGLKWQYPYAALIMKAFDEKYWKAPGFYKIDDYGNLKTATLKDGYTQMAHNFSMFWGISIMLYEATLISDQSKFDFWFASCRPRVTNPVSAANPALVPITNPTVTCLNPSLSADPTAPEHGGFTAQEVLGFGLFNNGGVGIRNAGSPSCSGCHPIANPAATGPLTFPLFSEAQFQAGQTFVPVERSRIDDRGPGTDNIPPTTTEGAVHDRGFFNIGVTPTSFDPGIGGVDPYGNPLSVARMFITEQAALPAVDPSGITDPCNTPTLIEGGFGAAFNGGRYPGCDANLNDTTDKVDPNFDWKKERELVMGSFKTPTLKNVGLTPPYFHNGAYSNLRQVVEFYARGGSRRNKSIINSGYTGDTSGTGPLGKDAIPVAGPGFGTNVDFFIRDIKSTEEQIDAMAAFMLTLTDRRVQCDQAPFDHPSFKIFARHLPKDFNRDGKADDVFFVLPEIGAAGYDPKSGYCIPNAGDLFAPGMQSRAGGQRVPLNE